MSDPQSLAFALMGQPGTADVNANLAQIPVKKGSILPLTQYGDNSARMDWTAGLPGALMEAFTAPARAYWGEIAPDQMVPEGLNFAGSVALGSATVPRPRGSVGMGSLKEGASHLDMSPEARMARAREMGFDTDNVYYHGTHGDFDAFDTSGVGVLGHGAYFTKNAPNTASVWARGEDGSVIPALLRGHYPDISEAGFLYRHMPNFIQRRMAEARGHDGYSTGHGGVVTVHDPSNIRSVNAAFDPARSGSANLLAANPETSAAPGLGLMAAAKQEPKGFTAYHGSPHDFDKFDMSKIGTGEGAQAYGHGLYFADAEDVAKAYRDNLTPQRRFSDARGIDSAEEALRQARETLAAIPKDNPRRKEIENIVSQLEQGHLGRMYQVRINADPEHFLDWERALNEQTPKVQDALRSLGVPVEGTRFDFKPSGRDNEWRSGDYYIHRDPKTEKYFWEKRAGADSKFGQHDWSSLDLAQSDLEYNGPQTPPLNAAQAYKRLMGSYDEELGITHSGGADSVSQRLRDAGIPGIKYLDQGSRASGEGSRNYVVFDDKLIEILKKYGLIGALGAGAAASGPDNSALAAALKGD